jgi:hypothetical protein
LRMHDGGVRSAVCGARRGGGVGGRSNSLRGLSLLVVDFLEGIPVECVCVAAVVVAVVVCVKRKMRYSSGGGGSGCSNVR